MSGYRPLSYETDGLVRMLETLRQDVEYLKRYRAPVVNHPEVEAGSIVVIQPSGGDAVSLGTQANPDAAGWSGNPSGWTDPQAHWIWHTALSGGGRPDNEEAWFVAEYESILTRTVDIEVACDNSATLYLNGVELGGVPDYLTGTTFTATLTPGTNLFAVSASNTVSGGGNPAGFLFSMRDATSGTVLLRSEPDGAWSAYTAEPSGWPTPGVDGLELDDLADVNAPSPGDGDALVWDAATSRWIAGTAGGGSGGGPWELLHTDDGTMTHWTSVSGTWSASGGVISQTTDSASYKFLRTTNPVRRTGFVIETDVRVVNTGSVYVGLFRWIGTAGLSGVGMRLYDDGSAGMDFIANAAAPFNVAQAWSRNTWYTLRFEYLGGIATMYLDGTATASGFLQPSNGSAPYLGLMNYGKPADFRNIRYWAIAAPT